MGEFNQNEHNQSYHPYTQEQPYQNFKNIDNSPLSMGQYLIMLLLMSIPLVNIILLFVWGFGDYNINKKNFARAYLILMTIGIVLIILFIIFLFSIESSMSESFYF